MKFSNTPFNSHLNEDEEFRKRLSSFISSTVWLIQSISSKINWSRNSPIALWEDGWSGHELQIFNISLIQMPYSELLMKKIEIRTLLELWMQWPILQMYCKMATSVLLADIQRVTQNNTDDLHLVSSDLIAEFKTRSSEYNRLVQEYVVVIRAINSRFPSLPPKKW